MIFIEYAHPGARAQICESVLRALPDWFAIEEALMQYVREAAELPMFVALDATAPVGFLTLHQHGPGTWEVHVIGVRPDHHRRGLGRRLLEEGERWLRTHDAQFLTVKTLSASAEYGPYESTRAFYLAMGFVPLMELPTLWSPEDPCLIMIKPLASSRSMSAE
jgi:GNAT superfamily N-acetyltransferase